MLVRKISSLYNIKKASFLSLILVTYIQKGIMGYCSKFYWTDMEVKNSYYHTGTISYRNCFLDVVLFLCESRVGVDFDGGDIYLTQGQIILKNVM